MKKMWEKQLKTGVVEIDIEHLTLIETVDALHVALQGGEGKDEVEETMNFLNNYVKIHFKHEEALLADYDYPGLDEHKKLHLAFIKEVEKLSQLIAENDSINNIMAVTHFCMDWLKKHIGVVDRKAADYILECRRQKND